VARVPSFRHDGHRIAYSEFGTGPRTCVLIHGLLLSQRMHEPLARDLAARGNHVVTIDLLGHGDSDRPRESWHYSMPGCAEQVVGLLDHLGLDEAVILGTSLGANAALEVCLLAPERVRGMVIEMPVLDHALVGCVVAFTPIMLSLSLAEPLLRLTAAAARAVPRRLLPLYGNVLLDTVRQEPGPSAAVMQGLFFGRVAPHPAQRRTFTAPALVIGHRRDPVHPLSDAGMLADELPNARLLEANSIIELRVSPERLTAEIAGFLDDCWRPARRPARVRRATI
jgi:pimeloyl-ACP methyl ester carboxylesterase